MVFQCKKSLEDFGDKVDSADKADVEAKISALEEALKGTDIETIKSRQKELETVFGQVATKVYQASAPQDGQGGMPGGNPNPGDEYVDIIGQSFYEGSDASFAGRFGALSEITKSKKILTVSSCDTLPSVDYMFRDNALWLWTAAGSGEYTLHRSGALSEEFNSVQYVKYFYNCKDTVALDELPDFNLVV